MKELEEQRNTMQSAQLSAERQKRAVAEKVHELEARIAALEAEKELLPTDLQSRSLYLLPVIVLCEPAVNPCEVALHRIYFLSVF